MTTARKLAAGDGSAARNTARLLKLGALAASAGLSAVQLRRLAGSRRMRTLAAEMHREAEAMRAWVRAGADPADAPAPSAALDAWQAELEDARAAKA